ncbi:unnamed protein product [Phytomonas sp. Hart1]|nr:unnamed protein product [Phytomonas sp. Hart1]|eukprot:CCW70173.1 unnamed protein product [Phytomonas sp. isolate Hart1]
MTSFEDRESKLLDGDDDEPQQRSGYQLNRRSDTSAYYMRLGVRKNASQQEIRRAFLKLSQHYHTDMYTTQSKAIQNAMNARFQELQEAYSVLSDVKKRAAYDAVGIKGPDRLALVPEGWATRDEVIHYVQSLEREAELMNTAKMLSASSAITVNYSIAHFFFRPSMSLPGPSSSLTSSAALPAAPNANDEGQSTEPRAPTPSTDASNVGEAPRTTSAPPSPSIPSPKPASAEENESPETIQAQMMALEVEIDGKRQIVLIPSAELQHRLREKIQSSSLHTGERPPPLPRQVPQPDPRRISTMNALLLTTLPQSILFKHSFEHAVSPKLNLVFSTQASARKKIAELTVGATSMYKRDCITTYLIDVKTRMKGLEISFGKERALSPLWSLRTKLTFLDGARFLQKLQLSLTRKLSPITELNNTITWCLRENGYWQSVLMRSWEGSSQYLALYIGLHTLSLVGSISSEVEFGGEAHDLAYSPAKGQVQYFLSTSLLSGETRMGFEVWYYHKWLKHYGLSFSTSIPYAPNPFAASAFFLHRSPHVMANQLSLLYKRGKHRISIPIVVLISPTISASVMWLSAPFCLFRLTRLLYRLRFNAKTAERLGRLRMENIAAIDLAREKAIVEQQALEQKVMLIRTQESGCSGLVIINARYGLLGTVSSAPTSPARPSGTSAARYSAFFAGVARGVSWGGLLHALPFFSSRSSRMDSSSAGSAMKEGAEAGKVGIVPLDDAESAGDDRIAPSLDVTVALQSLVRDSALMLPEGSKSQLVGFYDPDPYSLDTKQLKIAYWFQGKKHLAVFNDKDAVELPQREHLCS